MCLPDDDHAGHTAGALLVEAVTDDRGPAGAGGGQRMACDDTRVVEHGGVASVQVDHEPLVLLYLFPHRAFAHGEVAPLLVSSAESLFIRHVRAGRAGD